MKRKFAVAAATAALITASLSFTAFADKVDLTKATPEAAMAADDIKDKVQVSFDPAGDTFVITDGNANEFKGSGFVKYDGKLYYVAKTTNKYELVVEGKAYAVSADTLDTDVSTVYVKNGVQAKKQFVTYDGKEYYIDGTGALEKGTNDSDGVPEIVSCDVATSSSIVTTYKRLIADDGHIVKGWEDFSGGANQDKWCYAKENGDVVERTWVTTTLNRWFFIGDNGLMLTAGNAVTAGAGSNYAIVKDATNKVATVQQDKGATYVVGADGLWLSGWKFTDPTGGNNKAWYYYTSNGKPTGWVKYGEKWVLINGYKAVTNEKAKFDGAAVVEESNTGAYGTANGSVYAFDADSYLIIGSGKCNGVTVYSDAKGVVIADPVRKVGDDWYVAGAVATGIYKDTAGKIGDANVEYLHDATGKIVKNQWIKYEASTGAHNGNEAWSYADAKGVVVKSAAVKCGKTYCYVDADGQMYDGGVYKLSVTGNVVSLIAGPAIVGVGSSTEIAEELVNSVVINASGYRVYDGWTILEKAVDGTTTWGYAKDGKAYHGWVSYNNSWYYIDNGVMLTSQFTPDGYWVNADGVYTSKIR